MRDKINEKMHLKLLTPSDSEVIELFHKWYKEEEHHHRYTCRPIKALKSIDEYKENAKRMIASGILTLYLVDHGNVVGKLTMFDYNPRNHSAEFGYYLPMEHRQKGYGKIMVEAFLERAFSEKPRLLHKLYATTAEGNTASRRLLETFNFSLDGRIRDHYWFDDSCEDQLHYSLLRDEWLSSR